MSQPVELPCPRCGQVNRVPMDRVASAGELRCAACAERICVRVGHPAQPAAEPAFEAARRPGAPLRELADFDDGEAPAGAHVEPPEGWVTCPACRHQFDPRTGGSVRPTVLVVESADFFLHLVSDVLGQRYTVVGVRSVAEARRVLATRPVDLVLTDLVLPDGDGRDVLGSIPRPEIPVLLLSGRDDPQLGRSWEELRRLGARDVVHKGINMEDALAQKVEQLLGRT